MKKFFFFTSILCLFLGKIVFAQESFKGFNYQAVARNLSGTALSDKGASQYTEQHDLTTNEVGLFNLKIGKGNPQSGTFASIPWQNANQYLKVELAIGTGLFNDLGATQLMSVPFAIFAANGPTGIQGPVGAKGDIGLTGPQGAQGQKGDNGIQGLVGAKGDVGLTGPQGPIGTQGAQGLKGDTGSSGAQGLQGSKGDAGATGAVGPIGPQGAQGTKGDVGLKGDTGNQGPQGADGAAGAVGPKGDIGATGAVGPKGNDGSIISSPASGDLSGTFPNPSVSKLQGVPVSNVIPSQDQTLKFDGNSWVPASITGDNLGNGIATTDILLNDKILSNHGGIYGMTIDDNGGLKLRSKFDHSSSYIINTLTADNAGGFSTTGTYGDGTIPVQGSGVRMMWYPAKVAFRAGMVAGQEWNDVNIGEFSLATGYGTTASGIASLSLGYNSFARGDYSTTLGGNNEANGTASIALGANSISTGVASMASGFYAIATGQGSVALGYRITANANYSVALGYRASSNKKTGSMVMGDESTTDSVKNTLNNQFVARYAGGYRFYTSATVNGSALTGVMMANNANAWSTVSDSTKKENFAAASGEYFLKKLAALKLGSWNYKGIDKTNRHYGPYAQEIFSAFGKDKYGTIGCDTLLNTADMDGIMMIMIQALEKRQNQVEKSNEQIISLQQKISLVTKENEELKKQIEQIAVLTSRMEMLQSSIDDLKKQPKAPLRLKTNKSEVTERR
jgi:hypothetical protein